MGILKNQKHLLLYWLVLAALAEWLILRTVTRAAIHVPKSPPVITLYQLFNYVGLLAATFVALLGLLLLLWLAWYAWQSGGLIWRLLSLLLLGRVGLSLFFLITVPAGWLVVLSHLLTLGLIIGLVFSGLVGGVSIGEGRGGLVRTPVIALLLPALALMAGVLYQLLPALYTAVGWPGPPPLTGLLFNAGELLVVASVVVLWWVYGRSATLTHTIIAALPALLFTLSFWRDPAMTGILTIWSTGMTLFLPWPCYVLALWLAVVTVLAVWRQKRSVAYALLLLMSAGYAPQLSSQLFCALIGLWLLAQTTAIQPDSAAPVEPTAAVTSLTFERT
jgi:hypothetical protein